MLLHRPFWQNKQKAAAYRVVGIFGAALHPQRHRVLSLLHRPDLHHMARTPKHQGGHHAQQVQRVHSAVPHLRALLLCAEELVCLSAEKHKPVAIFWQSECFSPDGNKLICYKTGLVIFFTSNIISSKQIHHTIKYSTRAAGEELTEEEARIILKPFIKDGLQLQNQILLQQNELGLSATEVYEIENMTEDQLAEMSFTFQTIYNSAVRTQSISQQDIIDCLLTALGVNGIVDGFETLFEAKSFRRYISGTKMLITAKNAKQLLMAFGKRTAGWVGIAYMVYEFGDCLSNKQ